MTSTVAEWFNRQSEHYRTTESMLTAVSIATSAHGGHRVESNDPFLIVRANGEHRRWYGPRIELTPPMLPLLERSVQDVNAHKVILRTLAEASGEEVAPDDDSHFFNAWRRAVGLVHQTKPGIFGGTDLDLARDRDDLQPDVERVRSEFNAMSSGESAFIGGLVSFYSSRLGAELLTDRFGDAGLATLLNHLDNPRRRVLAELLLSYRGW